MVLDEKLRSENKVGGREEPSLKEWNMLHNGIKQTAQILLCIWSPELESLLIHFTRKLTFSHLKVWISHMTLLTQQASGMLQNGAAVSALISVVLDETATQIRDCSRANTETVQ